MLKEDNNKKTLSEKELSKVAGGVENNPQDTAKDSVIVSRGDIPIKNNPGGNGNVYQP